MLLLTTRLALKTIGWNDMEDIHHLHSNPLVNKYSFKSEPKNLEESIERITPHINAQKEKSQKNHTFSIRKLNSNEFIGLIGLSLSLDRFNMAEFFFELHPDFWNKGYASEAGKAIIQYALNSLKLHRIEANVTVGNEASVSVLKKLGFEQDALRRKIIPINKQWHDAYMFSLIE